MVGFSLYTLTPGGTAGLFAGVSLMSLVEILFWLLRLVCCRPIPSSATEEIDSKKTVGKVSVLVKAVRTYCERSTVHGFGYIPDRGLTKLENTIWGILTLIFLR